MAKAANEKSSNTINHFATQSPQKIKHNIESKLINKKEKNMERINFFPILMGRITVEAIVVIVSKKLSMVNHEPVSINELKIVKTICQQFKNQYIQLLLQSVAQLVVSCF